VNMPAQQRPGSLFGTVKAVLWGFLGVRRRADFQEDVARLNPLHLMAVGVVMAFPLRAGADPAGELGCRLTGRQTPPQLRHPTITTDPQDLQE